MCFKLAERGWKVIFFLFAIVLAAPLPSQATNYKVVDTGQDVCYDTLVEITCPQPGNPFYGQDAQYFGNQPSYTNNGDSTITDNITGLTWTKSPDMDGDGDIDVDDKLSFADALTYPDTLNTQNFGGHSDWRLPSIKELYSLMNFSGTDPSGPDGSGAIPFIDTAYFDFAYGDTTAGERTIDAQFWSSNFYLGTVFGDQVAAFGLNLADGRIKGYPTGGAVTKLNYVYFVRGNTNYGVNDFTDNGDGTITDNATGLMWMKNDNGAGILWENALSYAEGLEYAGYTDWHLPNAKEMQSIVDYSRAPDATGSAAIDPVFNITQITNEAGEVDYPCFWTSTTHVRSNGSGEAAAYICFGRAMGYMLQHGGWIDVHGAGAQRSDPKVGDPDDYPYGHGPQGDAVRIYNYVRCVRGGQGLSPVMDSIGPRTIDEGQILEFRVHATDPDGDSIILSVENPPANVTFTDSGNGAGSFIFSPDYTQADIYYIPFIASDIWGAADSETVQITVIEAGNQKPILDPISDQSVIVNETLSLVVTATDPDGTIPHLSADSLPTNATFYDSLNGEGLFIFPPDSTQSDSTYEVIFIASDDSLEDSVRVNITVVDFIRGDTNGDEEVTIADVVYLINYLFKNSPSPEPLESGNANCDEDVDIVDAVYLVNYLFKNGPSPGCP